VATARNADDGQRLSGEAAGARTQEGYTVPIRGTRQQQRVAVTLQIARRRQSNWLSLRGVTGS